MVQLSHEFPSDLSQLAAMRDLVSKACAQAWGMRGDEDAIKELQLALVEAAANVIRHAYQGEADRPVLLVIEGEADRVTLTLYHEGPDFDVEAVPPPSFDGSRSGGFGIYLMKQLADEVHFFQEQGRCGVRLVKNRPGENAR
jgi:serine/threonine-protein kinase RsbW